MFGFIYTNTDIVAAAATTGQQQQTTSTGGWYEEAAEMYNSRDFDGSFNLLTKCINTDIRCIDLLAEHFLLGLPPHRQRNPTAALTLFKFAADRGSANAQFALALLYSNLINPPLISPLLFNNNKHKEEDETGDTTTNTNSRPNTTEQEQLEKQNDNNNNNKVTEQQQHETTTTKPGSTTDKSSTDNNSFVAQDNSTELIWIEAASETNGFVDVVKFGRKVTPFILHGKQSFETTMKIQQTYNNNNNEQQQQHILPSCPKGFLPSFSSSPSFPSSDDVLPSSTAVGDILLGRREALSLTYLYAAAVGGGHTGAAMAMGYRHEMGYGVRKSCPTAAMYYMDVARKTARIYSKGIPQAVELIRLHPLTSKDRLAQKSHQVDLVLHVAEYQKSPKLQTVVGRRYLFGLDGLKQNYATAMSYLLKAAVAASGEAMGLIGYAYALGLGVDMDYDIAADWFAKAAFEHQDQLGYNGMGYIYFYGTDKYPRDTQRAFECFKESADSGFPDAQFNLGSLYMTGTGVTQSSIEAMQWFTKALEQNHTPAAYALAAMHYNGLGTVRDCTVVTALLKRVCERAGWVTTGLQKAYELEEAGHYDEAAFVFAKLAESGHEVAQANVAHLMDIAVAAPFGTDDRSMLRVHAQRYYELAAHQGSIQAELKLGDYAYNGWGLDTKFTSTTETANVGRMQLLDVSGNDMSGWLPEVRSYLVYQPVDYHTAFGHYRKAAESVPSGKWMSAYVARACHNIGMMYLYGLGVEQDFHMAKRFFDRVFQEEPTSPRAPVYVSLWLLWLMQLHQSGLWTQAIWSVLVDKRVSALMIAMTSLVALAMLRFGLQTAGRHQQQASADGVEPSEGFFVCAVRYMMSCYLLAMIYRGGESDEITTTPQTTTNNQEGDTNNKGDTTNKDDNNNGDNNNGDNNNGDNNNGDNNNDDNNNGDKVNSHDVVGSAGDLCSDDKVV
eukprot:GHVS01106986.1.p1 GENE.GHVS01106986.1~~GHVS01106986.1.p1  ORF type:complete len:1008 (+),score=252.37 GHVS01106986.1:169-3024(+)